MKPLRAALPLVLLLAACGRAPAPPAPGEALYRRELCTGCHGAGGEGTWMGPPLRGLAEHWEPESLAEFLLDPGAAVGRDPRLAKLMRAYPNPMVGTRSLGVEERRLLANWLLGL